MIWTGGGNARVNEGRAENVSDRVQRTRGDVQSKSGLAGKMGMRVRKGVT